VNQVLRLPNDYGLEGIDQWAAFILPRVHKEVLDLDGKILQPPLGFVFIIDPKFGESAQYKMVAGHKKEGETPLDTAVRELVGETNLRAANIDRFAYVDKVLARRRDHWKIIFTVDIDEVEMQWMNSDHLENEGEIPKFFTRDELQDCVNGGRFMIDHARMIDQFALVLPKLLR
jgi:8-oxo-dGTP pyrophosphatase MutT (NUDIX family)